MRKTKMRKLFRCIIAGLQLVFTGWLAYLIGGEPAYRDFKNQLRNYIRTGVADTSWVRRYLR